MTLEDNMICDNAERAQIHLVETLWEIECRYLLGSLSTPEYRRALAVLLAARPAERLMETEPTVEVDCA